MVRLREGSDNGRTPVSGCSYPVDRAAGSERLVGRVSVSDGVGDLALRLPFEGGT